MWAVEVNVSHAGIVVALGVSRRIKGHVSEREHAIGMVGNRQK
jgi:hypothetical protein